MLRNIQLIIFDLDGTLIDSLQTIISAVHELRAQMGLAPISKTRIQSFIGTGIEDLIHKATGIEDTDLFQDALTLFSAIFAKKTEENTILFPDVADLLEHFASIIKAIITNRRKDIAYLALKKNTY